MACALALLPFCPDLHHRRVPCSLCRPSMYMTPGVLAAAGLHVCCWLRSFSFLDSPPLRARPVKNANAFTVTKPVLYELQKWVTAGQCISAEHQHSADREYQQTGNTMDVLRPCFVCVAIIALLIAGAARRPPGRSQGEAGRRAAPPVRPGTWGGPGTCARLWAGDAAAAGTAAALPGGRSRLRPLLPAASICGAVSGLSCLHACCRAGLDATVRTGDINAVPFGLKTTTFITADRGGCQKCMVIELQTVRQYTMYILKWLCLQGEMPAQTACSDAPAPFRQQARLSGSSVEGGGGGGGGSSNAIVINDSADELDVDS